MDAVFDLQKNIYNFALLWMQVSRTHADPSRIGSLPKWEGECVKGNENLSGIPSWQQGMSRWQGQTAGIFVMENKERSHMVLLSDF